ncbi:leucine--tRNA ligase [Candidatus Parcubacteria bacterium]|nr:MAG: leucine--tRNA ligase [Candidatus Parcubacteria bacterium]
MKKYNPQKIERKWQKAWAKKKMHETKDKARGKQNFMLLTEFPYPSGDLHIGHWFSFAVPDILARYYRMKGKNVMYPMGFDAFGLPAENAAIKRNTDPRSWTEGNIKFMTKQLESMGASFDWSRRISTIDPEYYKWTQWLFLKMYEKGLAYRGEALVNWCPNDKTVLANEQVVDNCCERCGTRIEERKLTQWMIKITDYADSLIDDLEGLDWPENTKLAQKNWVGRSEGTSIKFSIFNFQFSNNSSISNKQKKESTGHIEVFTTRVDTIFGVTYLVVAPEHPIIQNQQSRIKNYEEVKKYVEGTRHKTELQRISEASKEKTGVELKGIKAINPANGEELPVWVADYVLASYGTGAVMAVPAHDERDYEFAKKYGLPIRQVVCPNYPKPICPVLDKAYAGEGHLVGSDKFDGMKSQEARDAITKWLEEKGLGKRKKIYRLRDWVISRQRYWGVPIPVIYCRKCGESEKLKVKNEKLRKNYIIKEGVEYKIIPVSESDLPIKLPKLDDFRPAEDGRSPLAKASKWVKVKCPNCGGKAERETDTMDTFVDSSWYYFRYTDPRNKKKFADPKKIKSWLPVPLYIGGAEHNTMHLLYSRFFSKFIADIGFADFKEPFIVRRNHGLIFGPDGFKMSKSRGNVIDPDELVRNFGADVVRMYLAFMTDYLQDGPWDPKGINGVKRFLERVYSLSLKIKNQSANRRTKIKIEGKNSKLEVLMHKTIKKVGEDLESLKFNTAVSALMILLNEMEKENELPVTSYSLLVTLLTPFAPHMAEEIWRSILGKKTSIHGEKWPKFDPKKLSGGTFKLIVQIGGKMRDSFEVEAGTAEEEVKVLTLKRENVRKWIGDKRVEKIIYVPNRIINIVLR